MKKLFSIGLLLAPCLSFADIGIGVSFQADDSRIYLPYEVSETLRIESSLRYSESDSDISTSNSSAFTDAGDLNGALFTAPVTAPISTISSSSSKNYEIGFGVFNKRPITENVSLLLGVRVGYIDTEQEFDAGTLKFEASGDGYFVAPTLAIEYLFGKNFSIGAEIAFRYEDIDISNTNNFSDLKTDQNITNKGTDTSLSARFYF